MTNASSLAFPASRTLEVWWRQLAPFEPQGLGVGYLFVHRLDAPAAWLQPQPVDPLLLLVLEALHLELRKAASPSASIHGRLHQRLNLDVPLLRRLLHSLSALHLIESKSSISNLESSWVLTELGQEAMRCKSVSSRQWKRGTFVFVERMDPTGHRLAPPHYLRILDAHASPWLVDEISAFQVTWLHACLDQSPQWKSTFGFPLDLVAFPQPTAAPAAFLPWDRVVLDRTERLLVAFSHGLKPEDGLFVFGVRPEGWVLNAAEPIVRLPAAAQALFSELGASPALEVWHCAWQSWCQMRGVPIADVNECSLSLAGERLRIAAPQRLMEYLQVGKSDIFNGDTWIMAGNGYVRQTARVEVVAK